LTNRSKNIGTAGETAVVKYLRRTGFPEAERRALAGQQDKGDILVCPGIIAEVKAGYAAEKASDHQLRLWVQETERERVNADAEHAFLVVKRLGHGATKIGGWHVVRNEFDMLAKFRLDDYVTFLQKITGRWKEEHDPD
jgi:hypothetical protein